MIDAYLVEFKTVVFAENQTEAMARVRWWRSLAAAAGWEPGAGRVSGLTDQEMTPQLTESLEKARAKNSFLATDRARDRAIQALSTHMGGDLGLARGVVESIENETGRLPVRLADALAAARKPVTEEAA